MTCLKLVEISTESQLMETSLKIQILNIMLKRLNQSKSTMKIQTFRSNIVIFYIILQKLYTKMISFLNKTLYVQPKCISRQLLVANLQGQRMYFLKILTLKRCLQNTRHSQLLDFHSHERVDLMQKASALLTYLNSKPRQLMINKSIYFILFYKFL